MMRSSLIPSLNRLRSKLDLPGLDSLREYQRDEANALGPNDHGLLFRIYDSLSRTWDLGVTAFGGPAVLFQIVHHRFVDGAGGRVPWIDEQTVRQMSPLWQAEVFGLTLLCGSIKSCSPSVKLCLVQVARR